MEELCRICLSNGGCLLDIFGERAQHGDELSFVEKLNECVDCKVELHDNLPKKICQECTVDAKTAFNFKRRCEQSYKLLTMKTEIDLEELVKTLEAEEWELPNRIPDTDCVKIEHEESPERQKNFKAIEDNIIQLPAKTTNTLQLQVTSKESCQKNKSSSAGQQNCKAIQEHLEENLLPTITTETFKRKLRDRKSFSLGTNQCPVRLDNSKTTRENFEEKPERKKNQLKPSSKYDCQQNKSQSPSFRDKVSIKIQSPVRQEKCNPIREHLQQKEFLAETEETPKTQDNKSCSRYPVRKTRNKNSLKCSHTSELQSDTSPQLNELTVKAPSHQCLKCSKTFNRHDNLKAHSRMHTGERPYKCPHCLKKFAQSHHVKDHIRALHSGQRPHKCPHCNKAFSQKSNLQAHIYVHDGEGPYKCTHCSKTYTRNYDLNLHLRDHAGDRPHKCTDCSKAFSRRRDLQRHIRVHTGEQPFKCCTCTMVFSRKDQLKIHKCAHVKEGSIIQSKKRGRQLTK